MKALLFDVGNTRLKWGVLENGGIHRTGHVMHDKIRSDGIASITARLPRDVDAAMASNVAGQSFATRLAGIVGMHCRCELHFARSEREACGVTNSYRVPRRMGVDRWVAMIGARAEVGATCLVVDAGTAVTIDALDDDGQHLGGQILPGVSLMATALTANTSDIPKSNRSLRASLGMDIFATDTGSAVAHGALNAVVGAVDRAMAALQEDGYDPWLVLTGGDASRILGSLDYEAMHRPNLVLQGLAELLEHRS